MKTAEEVIDELLKDCWDYEGGFYQPAVAEIIEALREAGYIICRIEPSKEEFSCDS